MKVTLYGAPFCQNCQSVKRILANKGIEFKYLDVADDEKAAIALVSLGFMSLPVLEVGENISIGMKAVEVARGL
jgi:glutaredoxin